jgi:hypothetical protein
MRSLISPVVPALIAVQGMTLKRNMFLNQLLNQYYSYTKV